MAEDHEKAPGFNVKKSVDESWKDTVEKEKHADEPERGVPPPAPDFLFFLSTLGMQTLQTLGEIADPASGEKKTDLPHAQYLIGTIQMLCEKTKGNLTKEEEQMAQGLLYELRMKFVQKSGL
jgi:hypothetical protein